METNTETTAAIDAVMQAANESETQRVFTLSKSDAFNGPNRGYITFRDAHGNDRTVPLSQRVMQIIGAFLSVGREGTLLSDASLVELSLDRQSKMYMSLMAAGRMIMADVTDDSMSYASANGISEDAAVDRIQATYHGIGQVAMLASIAGMNHQQLHGIAHVMGTENPLLSDYGNTNAAAAMKRIDTLPDVEFTTPVPAEVEADIAVAE